MNGKIDALCGVYLVWKLQYNVRRSEAHLFNRLNPNIYVAKPWAGVVGKWT